MYVYLSVMFLCCILLYAMRNDNNKVKPLAIVFGAVWLMIALQDGWGGDHEAYIELYGEVQGLSFQELLNDDSHGALGYKLLMSNMPSTHAGLCVGLAIWCFAVAFFFYHFIPQKWWFFAILFVFWDRAILMGMIASYLRMAIANAFLIFAVFFILKEKKRWLSALLIIAGSLFHASVLFMLPLVLVGKNQNKIQYPTMVGFFVLITIFFSLAPSVWVSFVEGIIMSVDPLEAYSTYFENQQSFETKGLVLIILFYWIYLLSKMTNKSGLENKEYLVLYYALIRIAFDLLPAFGLSTRFFYYIDLYFFAGMMCLMNRLPKNDANRWGIALTLIVMFYYVGFHAYAITDFYKLHWGTYNFIF